MLISILFFITWAGIAILIWAICNGDFKNEDKIDKLEEKLNFIADRLGYEIGYDLSNLGWRSEQEQLKRWDGLIEALNLEWTEGEAHYKKIKKSKK